MENKTSISGKIYETLTQTMIELLQSLKSNPERWERPWIISENGQGAHNALTKRTYSGINQIFLSYLCIKYNYQFNRWLTFRQVQELGGSIKKGSKSAMIIFAKVTKVNANDKKKTQEEEEQTKSNLKTRFLLTYYNVFNVEQCEGLGQAFYQRNKQTESKFNQVETAEKILNNCGVQIQYKDQNRAFYSPGLDLISLPNLAQFKSESGYYETVFHELGHSTGHPSRLNRKLFNLFGDEDYAREELTAEMCSVFVCSLCGIDFKIKNSAAYIDSWLEVLESDKSAFVRSTMQAQTACNYIIERSGMQHLKQSVQQEEQIEPIAA